MIARGRLVVPPSVAASGQRRPFELSSETGRSSRARARARSRVSVALCRLRTVVVSNSFRTSIKTLAEYLRQDAPGL